MNGGLLKKSFFYLIGTVIVAIGGFIVSLLYSYFFDTTSYGNYCLIFSIYSLVSHFVAGWLSISVIRNYEHYKKEKLDNKMVATSFKYLLYSSIILILITFISMLFIDISLTLKTVIILFSFIYFFEFAILLLNSMYRIEENIKQYNINTTTNSIIKLIVILILYYIAGLHNIVIIPISLLITEFIQFIIISKKRNLYSKIKSVNFDFSIIKNLFAYGFPLMGISITSWILNTSDRFVIAFFFDTSYVGLYSYAYSLANSIFTLLIQFIMLGAYPNIIKKYEEDGVSEAEECISDYLNIYMLVLVPLCVGATLVSKDFFTLFTSHDYHESFTIFMITSISIFVLGLTQYYNKPFELKKDTKKILIINIIIALVNIILNFVFMKKIGYVFGAWSTLISYLLYILIAILFNDTGIRVKYNYKIIFKIILSTIYMVVFIYVIDYFIANTLLSFLLKILIGGLVYSISILIYKVVKIKRKKELK